MADFYRISEPEGKRLFYKELLLRYCFYFQYWELTPRLKVQSQKVQLKINKIDLIEKFA
jgi:hypothetical protein